MVSPSNNLAVTTQDATTSFYNNYYVSPFDVSQGEDDTVVSFFEKMSANKETARTLAGSVIYTARAQGLDPMAVIQQFSTLPTSQLNAYLVLFLNQNRVGTSYLGLSNKPIINKYTQRSILP